MFRKILNCPICSSGEHTGISPLLSRIAVSSRPPGLLFHNLIARGAGAGSLRPSFGCKCFGLDRSTNSWCLLLESAIFVEKPIEITPSPFSSFGSIDLLVVCFFHVSNCFSCSFLQYQFFICLSLHLVFECMPPPNSHRGTRNHAVGFPCLFEVVQNYFLHTTVRRYGHGIPNLHKAVSRGSL